MIIGLSASINRALSGGSAPFSPLSLFTVDTGAYYQNDDLSTQYQLSGGSPIVSGGEQSLGLFLDKSKALALGSEVAATWVNGSVPFGSFTPAGLGCSAVKSTAGTVQFCTSGSFTTSVGQFYKIEIVVSALSGMGLYVGLAVGTTAYSTPAYAITSAGTYTIYCAALYTNTIVSARISAASAETGSFTVDSISVKSIAGNHLVQSTASARHTVYGDGSYYDLTDGVNDNLASVTGGGATTAFAYMSVIQPTQVGVRQTLFSDVGTNTGYKVEINTSNQLVISAGNGSAYISATTANAVALNTKYTVECYHDGSNLVAILNEGTPVSVACGTRTAGTAGFTVNKDNDASSGYFKGGVFSRIYGKNTSWDLTLRSNAMSWLKSKSGYNTPYPLSVFAIGDSTVSDYSSYTRVLGFVTSRYEEVTVAFAGDTIAQQKTRWIAASNKNLAQWVVVEVGLNDLAYLEASPVAIARLQDLIDTIKIDVPASCKVLVAKMTPCKSRLIALYGGVNGLISYQKWLDINDAIAGGGATPITGVDGRVTSHETALNDGSGNLAGAYDTGDGIHENNAGRAIIAAAWETAIIAAGGTV